MPQRWSRLSNNTPEKWTSPVPANEAQSALGSNPQSDALLGESPASVRLRIGRRTPTLVMLRNRGESVGPFNCFRRAASRRWALEQLYLHGTRSPANPFTDYIVVDYPVQGLNAAQ